jgi:hypothetical protein
MGSILLFLVQVLFLVLSQLCSSDSHSDVPLSLCVACVVITASNTHKHNVPSQLTPLAHTWELSSFHRTTGDDYIGRNM